MIEALSEQLIVLLLIITFSVPSPSQMPVKTPKDCDFRLTTVWDTAGLPLGRVTDVYVSPMTHEVKALEVSLGPVETMRTGRCIARTFSVCDALPEAGAVMIPCGYALERTMDGR